MSINCLLMISNFCFNQIPLIKMAAAIFLNLAALQMITSGDLILIKLVDMMTSSMETVSVLLAICVGNSPVPGEFPAQRPVTRSFDVFFDLRPNKQSRGWWFQMPSHSSWRHCTELCATENLLSKLDIFIKQYHLNVIVYLIPREQWVKPLVTQFMEPYMHHQAQQSILADLVQVPWVQAWQA